jgi:phosphoserine phosphatase
MHNSDFVQSILRLSPRVAAFDCDGTLWAGDTGQRFFYWEIGQGLIQADVAARALERYADYLDGTIAEESICGEMVSIHEGLLNSELEAISREFFHRFVAPEVYPEMAQLIEGMQALGTDVWLVSSTNCWVIRGAAEWLAIPAHHVIAATPVVDGDLVTSALVYVPTGDAKASCFREMAGSELDVAFGNSEHDAALLALARFPFAINPDSKLLQIAIARRWSIYFSNHGRLNS